MSVDVSKEADYIRHKTYGLEVRGSLADGIEKIAGEVNGFESGIEQRQTEFENNITEKQDKFEDNTLQEQNTFEESISKQQNDYENNVSKQWSDYKTAMDADEATRQQNEQNRISNEDTRATNENIRQQNELVRQNNETDRKNNETARETAFNNMQHMDANVELAAARGTFSTVNDRLNNSEGETLANKELISITHNLNGYPNIRCICTNYGAGVGGAGEGNAGGTESYLVNAKIAFLDTNNIKIFVPANYLIKSPLLEKINDSKYILTSSDTTELKSMQIEIQEVA